MIPLTITQVDPPEDSYGGSPYMILNIEFPLDEKQLYRIYSELSMDIWSAKEECDCRVLGSPIDEYQQFALHLPTAKLSELNALTTLMDSMSPVLQRHCMSRMLECSRLPMDQLTHIAQYYCVKQFHVSDGAGAPMRYIANEGMTAKVKDLPTGQLYYTEATDGDAKYDIYLVTDTRFCVAQAWENQDGSLRFSPEQGSGQDGFAFSVRKDNVLGLTLSDAREGVVYFLLARESDVIQGSDVENNFRTHKVRNAFAEVTDELVALDQLSQASGPEARAAEQYDRIVGEHYRKWIDALERRDPVELLADAENLQRIFAGYVSAFHLLDEEKTRAYEGGYITVAPSQRDPLEEHDPVMSVSEALDEIAADADWDLALCHSEDELREALLDRIQEEYTETVLKKYLEMPVTHKVVGAEAYCDLKRARSTLWDAVQSGGLRAEAMPGLLACEKPFEQFFLTYQGYSSDLQDFIECYGTYHGHISDYYLQLEPASQEIRPRSLEEDAQHNVNEVLRLNAESRALFEELKGIDLPELCL